jgi:hypothetical protein
VRVTTEGLTWNYTTWLNIGFLILAGVLLVRFLRTGGREMLRMMGGAPDATEQHGHHLGPSRAGEPGRPEVHGRRPGRSGRHHGDH